MKKLIRFIAIAHFMILRLFTAGSMSIFSFSCLFLLLKLSRSLIFSFEAQAQAELKPFFPFPQILLFSLASQAI